MFINYYRIVFKCFSIVSKSSLTKRKGVINNVWIDINKLLIVSEGIPNSHIKRFLVFHLQKVAVISIF